MRAQLGTPVRTRDDKPLGPVEWLLVDPETLGVKSVGVRHGRIRDHAVKVALDEMSVSPGLEYLIANVDDEAVEHLVRPSRPEESEALAGEAVAASTSGGVWPADTFVSKYPEPGSVPMRTEFENMVNMLDADVVVLGEGSDVYTKNMHHVGEIHQMRFDANSGELLSIELKRGFLHHQEFELPGDQIAGVDEGSVYLNVDLDEVKKHILSAGF